MRSFTKQLIFLLVIVAIFATGILATNAVGNIKVKPSLTPKIKMAISRTAIATPQSVGNPVGWWKMDEGTAIHGSSVADSSGYGNTGTLSTGDGATEKSVAGKLGKGLSFDGVNDYVSTAVPYFSGSAEITFTAWIKTTTNSTLVSFVSCGETGSYGTQGLFFYMNNKATAIFGTNVGETSYIAGTTNINNGVWHFVVGTHTSSKNRVYVDGVQEGEANANTLSGGRATFDIGRFPSQGSPAWYFNGLLDDVRIYNRALSAGEVSQMYNSTKDGYLGNIKVSTGLVGYWKLDDNNALTSVIDYSGKGNTGTAYSGTATTTSVLSTSTAMIGRAMSFDGVDDWVDAGSGSSLDITTNLTISAWINPLIGIQAVNRGIVGKSTLANSWGRYGLLVASADADRTVGFVLNNATVYITYTLPTWGAWYHIVGTYDKQNARLYVNGVQVNSVAYTANLTGAGNVYFGENYLVTQQKYKGLIDEVKIWNYARSAEQIKQDYERGLRGLP